MELLRTIFFVSLLFDCGGAQGQTPLVGGSQGRGGARAQSPLGIAFYDVDRIYDTIPALFYNDEEYTPDGRMHWNTERYQRKIRNTAAVIDSMRLPITALWGVENEEVVRDISAACQGDYSYLHRTLNTLDGMDFALFYYGDIFLPDFTEVGNRYLYVEGELRGVGRIGLLMSGNAHFATMAAGDLREERPGVKLIIMGRCDGIRGERYGLTDATARAERAGRGTVHYSSGWRMRDRILVDTALHARGGDVFARRYMVDDKSGYPLSTYKKKVYNGGYSYSLPVFVYIR